MFRIKKINTFEAIKQRYSLLIFGGSFDPVHLGHLKTALSVQDTFCFDRFMFVPCKTPILKQATLASPQQRLDMLRLAIMDYPGFEIDSREINRSTPSFMIETLRSFRSEMGNEASITLLLGMDTFLSLPDWHDWQHILDECHLLVMDRPIQDQAPIPQIIQQLLVDREVSNHKQLLTTSHGLIVRFNAGNYWISSSEVRKKLIADHAIKDLLSEKVYQYIKAQALYSSHQ